MPSKQFLVYDPTTERSIAFQSRPEIQERLADIKENAIVLRVSENQLLPRLALSLSSSLNGFDDNRDAFGAVGNYSELPPSGTAAAALELPIRNRAARARNKQAHLKATRLLLQYEDQILRYVGT